MEGYLVITPCHPVPHPSAEKGRTGAGLPCRILLSCYLHIFWTSRPVYLANKGGQRCL